MSGVLLILSHYRKVRAVSIFQLFSASLPRYSQKEFASVLRLAWPNLKQGIRVLHKCDDDSGGDTESFSPYFLQKFKSKSVYTFWDMEMAFSHATK